MDLSCRRQASRLILSCSNFLLRCKAIRATPSIRLVELGHPFDDVISSLASNDNSFEPLAKFADELKSLALSSFAYAKGKTFMQQNAVGWALLPLTHDARWLWGTMLWIAVEDDGVSW